jgi:phage-related baseplate assembly protein
MASNDAPATSTSAATPTFCFVCKTLYSHPVDGLAGCRCTLNAVRHAVAAKRLQRGTDGILAFNAPLA